MTPIRKTIQEYLVARAAEGKAPRTLEVYGARLRRFAEELRLPRVSWLVASPSSLS
jgi:hypothetical protein